MYMHLQIEQSGLTLEYPELYNRSNSVRRMSSVFTCYCLSLHWLSFSDRLRASDCNRFNCIRATEWYYHWNFGCCIWNCSIWKEPVSGILSSSICAWFSVTSFIFTPLVSDYMIPYWFSINNIGFLLQLCNHFFQIWEDDDDLDDNSINSTVEDLYDLWPDVSKYLLLILSNIPWSLEIHIWQYYT